MRDKERDELYALLEEKEEDYFQSVSDYDEAAENNHLKEEEKCKDTQLF